jgi:hypothetical protein
MLADNKRSSAGENDLGDKQHIKDYFTRCAAGEPLQDIIVLQSIPGRELVGARITKGSVKNVQLQVNISAQCCTIIVVHQEMPEQWRQEPLLAIKHSSPPVLAIS